MKLIDLSHPIGDGMMVYPGDPQTEVRFESQAGFILGEMKASFHTGTHIDAPRHALPSGQSINQMPLDWMISNAFVWHPVIKNQVIQSASFQADYLRYGKDAKTILVHTGHDQWMNSNDYFKTVPKFDHQWVDTMKHYGIHLIGIDAPTFSSMEESDLFFHQHLFEAGIFLVENLTHLELLPNQVEFLCFPLKIEQGDASWVRTCARF